jgi:large subunit ribosomal protein L6e
MGSNAILAGNVERLSKSQIRSRRSKVPKKGVKAEAAAEPATTKTKTVGGKNNGSSRTVAAIKAPKYYDNTPETKRKVARKTNTAAKLRSSITPGSVLILLAGRFRGKRVVFLKQLPSGLLLVSGPYKINGVPLRRVNQAYVIATSTKVDISSVSIDEKINDAYFSKDSKRRSQGSEKEFFGDDKKAAESAEKKSFPADKAADQKSVDKALLAEIEKTEHLAKYLGNTFALSKGQFPHLMKF